MDMTQDPFRRRRGKLGEPLFSPKQQKSFVHRKRPEQKLAEDKHGGLNGKVMPQVKVVPLKLTDAPATTQPDPLATEKSRDLTMTGKQIADLSPRFEKPPPLKLDSDTPKLESGDPTPREALETSLETYRRLQLERDLEVPHLGTIPVQKIHQNKTRKEKTALKTALVSVDLDSVERADEKRRAKMSHMMKERFANHSHGEHNAAANTQRSSKAPTSKEEGHLTSRSLSSLKDASPKNLPPFGTVNKNTGNGSTSLATIFFNPPGDRLASNPPIQVTNVPTLQRLTTNITANDISSQEMPGTPAQSEADSQSERARMKAVHLEVFGEKKASARQEGPIKIPTGRVTLHPGMPAYRLDLLNYPPSNARQSCGIRSSSAGRTDSRQTQLTRGTLNRPGTSHLSHPTGPASDREPPNSADGGINIRFAGKGEVILTSAAGKKPDRVSR